MSESDPLASIDHLVYASPDLDRGIREIERLIGVRAKPGGQHPGRGTRNALLALGPRTYLEIVGVDPDQPPPSSPRAFGIDQIDEPRLATWVVRSSDVDVVRRDAIAKGISLGEVKAGRRQRTDGVTLSWRFTEPGNVVADGLVPFYIDWGDSPHPSLDAPKGATLVALRAEHPDYRRVQQMLESLHLGLSVTQGSRPALVALIDGPRGRVELR